MTIVDVLEIEYRMMLDDSLAFLCTPPMLPPLSEPVKHPK